MTTFTIQDLTRQTAPVVLTVSSDATTFIAQSLANIFGSVIQLSYPNPLPPPSPLPGPGPPFYQSVIAELFFPPAVGQPTLRQGSWATRYSALAALPLALGQSAAGVPITSALLAAGTSYDRIADVGVNNPSVAALLFQFWSTNTGAPAWVELDRVSRSAGASGAALPWDPTLQTQAALTARYTAAVTSSSGNAPVLNLLTLANAAWTSALASAPSSPTAASIAATNALNVALANAAAFVASLGTT